MLKSSCQSKLFRPSLKNLLQSTATDMVPGLGIAFTVVDCYREFLELRDSNRKRRQASDMRDFEPFIRDSMRVNDIIETTLNDLDELMGKDGLPVIVFCDDAQFAGKDGDEGVYRLLDKLWASATRADWPLLLVLTHWAADWEIAAAEAREESFAGLLWNKLDGDKCIRMELHREPELDRLVVAGLPDFPKQDIDLLLDKADGNPQVLIELVQLVQRSRAWRDSAGALTANARKRIEERTTDLVKLIIERLESDATPEAVRQAAALSSVQGMRFLHGLTAAAATALDIDEAGWAMQAMENPHRLAATESQGKASFLQRAFREAAMDLLDRHVADISMVEETLLDVAIAILDDMRRLADFSWPEGEVLLTIVAGLGEKHDDAGKRRYAGDALLKLVIVSNKSNDFAKASEAAVRFERGLLEGLWKARDFNFHEMEFALDAIDGWISMEPERKVRMLEMMVDALRVDYMETNSIQSELQLADALERLGTTLQLCEDIGGAERALEESLELCLDLDKLGRFVGGAYGAKKLDSLVIMACVLASLGDIAIKRNQLGKV